MMTTKNLYRPCVGIITVKKGKGIFGGKRKGKFSYSWQMPQGGIEENEDPLKAAFRELKEETSITSAKLIKSTSDWLYYDLPKDVIPKFWSGKYIGQKQKWFLMEFTGKENEINTETEDPEFTKWQWASPNFLIENIVPFKIEIYKDLFSHFAEDLKKLDI